MAASFLGIARWETNSPGAAFLAHVQLGSEPSLERIRDLLMEAPTHLRTKFSQGADEKNNCHVSVDPRGSVSILTVCICEASIAQPAVAKFLDETQSRFGANSDWLQRAISQSWEGALQSDCQPILDEALKNFNRSLSGGGKVDRLKQQVAEVKQTMVSNVERVLERGDRLDELMDRSTDLEHSSSQFRSHGRQLRRNLCMRNFKWTLITLLAVFLVLLVIVLIILYETGAFGKKPAPHE